MQLWICKKLNDPNQGIEIGKEFGWGGVFDMIMSNYNVSLWEIQEWTREQIFLFKEKIEDRMLEERKYQAKLQGGDLKTNNGLDTEGAIPIEVAIDKGIVPVKRNYDKS